ncbi:MAG: hypothetical protein K8L97_18480 [Anaerolineae bacterium]|nr:hypothetical protein [Anaerolineae bacterium]
MDAFIEMLRSWQNYYFMAGGAAAGLLGLMFVAMSLGMHLVSDDTREDIKTFVTPSVFYFVSALLISCAMLVPTYAPPALGLILLVGGVIGLVRTVRHVRGLIQAAREHQDFTVADWLAQIVGPVVSYTVILASGVCFFVDQWSIGFMSLWLADVIVLVCAIANTWSLVMWIIEQRTD